MGEWGLEILVLQGKQVQLRVQNFIFSQSPNFLSLSPSLSLSFISFIWENIDKRYYLVSWCNTCIKDRKMTQYAIQKSKCMLWNLKNLQNMHYAWIYSPKGQNMQTSTEKVSIFGVVKSSNVYFQSLRSVTNLYKNMHLHGNPGSSYKSQSKQKSPSPRVPLCGRRGN